jgi:hypothetical protein
MFMALSAFVEAAMDSDRQTAGDVVSFVARLTRLDYDLKSFNGTFSINEDGAIEYEDKGEYEAGKTPQHMQPGMFRVKPRHVAYGSLPDATQKNYYRDATLARLKAVVSNGKSTQEPVENDKVQELCIDDRRQYFLVGKPKNEHGERDHIHIRVGRNTFFNATDGLIKMEAAEAEIAAENARKEEYRKQAELRAKTDKAYNPTTDTKHPDYKGSNAEGRSEGEGQPASKAPAQPEKPQAAPSGQGQAQPTPQAQPGKVEPAKPETQPQDRRVNEDQTRDDAEKNRMAARMEDMHTLVRGYFAPEKLRQNPAALAQAKLIYVTLLGTFTSLGLTKFLADPVKNIKEQEPLTKPVTSKTNPAAIRRNK